MGSAMIKKMLKRHWVHARWVWSACSAASSKSSAVSIGVDGPPRLASRGSLGRPAWLCHPSTGADDGMHACVRAFLHVCVRVRACAHWRACVRAHVRVRAQIHACIYAGMQARTLTILHAVRPQFDGG